MMRRSRKAAAMAFQKAKSGLPLTQDQHDKLMLSARSADAADERKKQKREAAKAEKAAP